MTIRTALIDGLLQEPWRNRPLYQVYLIALRNVTRNRRIFPSDKTVFKAIYPTIQNITRKWTMPIHNLDAGCQFLIDYAGRFPNDERRQISNTSQLPIISYAAS